MATLTVSPAFDNFALQDTDLTTGMEWTLGNASAGTFTAGYVATIIDPNKIDYYYRAGLDFTVGVGALPLGSVVTAVSLRLNVNAQDGNTGTLEIAKKNGAGLFSAESDPETFWDTAEGGTLFLAWSPSSAAPHLYTLALNAAAVTAFQATVSVGGTVSIGIAETGPLDVTSLRRFIDSQNGATSGNRPLVTITYTPPASAASGVPRTAPPPFFLHERHETETPA